MKRKTKSRALGNLAPASMQRNRSALLHDVNSTINSTHTHTHLTSKRTQSLRNRASRREDGHHDDLPGVPHRTAKNEIIEWARAGEIRKLDENRSIDRADDRYWPDTVAEEEAPRDRGALSLLPLFFSPGFRPGPSRYR